MRLFVFYPYVPYPVDRGAYHRAFQLLRALAAEHEVDLLALAERGEGIQYKPVFQEFCRRVEVVPFVHPPWAKLFPDRLLNPWPTTIAHWTVAGVGEAAARMLREESYDAAHVYDIVLAQYFLKENRQIPLVVDRTRVDLYYQWMEQHRMRGSIRERLLNWENIAKLWRFERVVAGRSRLQVVCGPDDARVLRRFVRRHMDIEVIPNGVDLEFFHSGAADAAREPAPSVLFCGAMDYNPNVDALRWFFSEMHERLLLRIPSLKVWVVGKDPANEVRAYQERRGVTVTGGVPDVRPFYRRAWLQIVPLRIGGGTRLKIPESMAMGTPVVSTTIGAQGLHLGHGRDILLADTAEEFVAQTARALEDGELRMRLEQAGSEAVRSRLSWPSLGEELNRAYARRFSKTGQIKASFLAPASP